MMLSKWKNVKNSFVFVVRTYADGDGRTFKMDLDPKLYSSQSGGHQKEAKFILETYAKKSLTWKSDETAMDMGCGPGDVTHCVLLPFVGDKVKSIKGVDYNPKMIEFAKERYANPKLKFEVGDMGSTKWNPKPEVDKIFSFFAIQWVPDKKTVAANIFNSLSPGGQAFLLIVAKNGLYNVWDKIVKSDTWSKHLPDAPSCINEYVYSADAEGLITDTLKNAGLKIECSATVERKNIFKAADQTNEEMKKTIRMVDPYVSKLPEEMRECYLDDVLDLLKKSVSPTGANDYTAVVVTASKPC